MALRTESVLSESVLVAMELNELEELRMLPS